MPKADVFDLEKNKVEDIDLDPKVFEAPVTEHLLHSVASWQMTSRRSGSSSAKTRGEIRGSNSKPWKQKGMGRARAGTRKSPLWRKGGVIFGPKPKDWSYSLPKKVRKSALRSALSKRYSDGALYILRDFELPEIKTKQIVNFMKTFELNKTLLVIDGDNENLRRSARNIKNIKVIKDQGLNVVDVLKFNNVIILKNSLQRIQELLA